MKWTEEVHDSCHMPSFYPAESQAFWSLRFYRCRNLSRACAFNLASKSMDQNKSVYSLFQICKQDRVNPFSRYWKCMLYTKFRTKQSLAGFSFFFCFSYYMTEIYPRITASGIIGNERISKYIKQRFHFQLLSVINPTVWRAMNTKEEQINGEPECLTLTVRGSGDFCWQLGVFYWPVHRITENHRSLRTITLFWAITFIQR